MTPTCCTVQAIVSHVACTVIITLHARPRPCTNVTNVCAVSGVAAVSASVRRKAVSGGESCDRNELGRCAHCEGPGARIRAVEGISVVSAWRQEAMAPLLPPDVPKKKAYPAMPAPILLDILEATT